MADLLDQATVDQGPIGLSLMADADFDRDIDGRRTHSSKETSDYLTIDLLKTERYDLNKTATENLKSSAVLFQRHFGLSSSNALHEGI